MIVLRAPAKVNLWLRILAREEGSGYHQIETAFCRLELADELVFETAPDGFSLTVEGAELGDPAKNLVSRAARAFGDAAAIDPRVRVRLRKRIPAGAGLGGGSSDAAATLLALNRIHGWPLDRTSLHAIACGLGADVPFFLSGASIAVGWGRGDRLLALPAPPAAAVLIVWPGTPIPTADAYAALTGTTSPSPQAPLSPDHLSTWAGIAGRAHNDFETVAPLWVPRFAGVRDALIGAGARIAMLAGSGSAVFGLFDDRDEVPADAIQSLFPEMVTLITRTAAAPLAAVDPTPGPG